ncbi:MAG: hypothetical protein JO099_08830 [Acidobacteriia bacterium]|nr:hypothetical protein [Terriglobia bacterium]
MKRALFGYQFTGIVAVSALFAQSAAAQGHQAQGPRYTITDLGPASLSNPANPIAITNNDLIATAEPAANGAWHASIQFFKLQIDLAKAGGFGGPNSMAWDVNEWGQAVGEAETADLDPNKEDFCVFGTQRVCHPFIWQNGVMSALPRLKDASGNAGRNAVAKGINNLGQVVGMAENTTADSTCPPYNPSPTALQFQYFQFKPVMWTNGRVQELPTLGNEPDGIAFKINDRGQAAGATGTCTGLTNLGTYLYGLHATLWQNGSAIDLGNLGGVAPGWGNWAYDINNAGHVVGTSGTSDGSFHAFFWSPKTLIKDLGTIPANGTVPADAASIALGINEIGDVTGISFPADPNASPRAFLRLHGGTMVDLNSLVPANSSLYLFSACAINSRGEIVGIAVDGQGNAHGYLATPSSSAAQASILER